MRTKIIYIFESNIYKNKKNDLCNICPEIIFGVCSEEIFASDDSSDIILFINHNQVT